MKDTVKRTYTMNDVFKGIGVLTEVKYELLRYANAHAVLGNSKLTDEFITLAGDVSAAIDDIKRGYTASHHAKGEVTVDVPARKPLIA